MRIQRGAVWFATCGVLLGGCRSEYLVQHEVIQAALMRPESAQQIAVAVTPRPIALLADPSAAAPQTYVRLSALRVDRMSLTGRWRVSTHDGKRSRYVGGVLLGLGVASFIGGTLIARYLTDCSGGGEVACFDGLPMFVGSVPLWLGGAAMGIIGGVLASRPPESAEVPGNAGNMVYISEPAASAALPPTAALGAGFRY